MIKKDKKSNSEYLYEGGLAVDSYEDIKESISIYNINRSLNHIPKVSLIKGDAVKTIPKFIEDNSEIVISSAGIQNTVTKFLKDNNDTDYQKKLSSLEPSFGHACLYVGFNQTAEELNIKDTNLWIYPSYDHDYNTNTFMNDESADFPVVYISFPSSKDPEWTNNYPGTATLEAIVPTNYSMYNKWANDPWKNRGDDYESYKEKLSQRIIKQIYKHNPHLENKISFYELSSPLSTRDMANYQFGELYGIDHTPSRFRQKWLKPKTPIKNLFMTGQDITTVGLPSALMSGVLTCSTLLTLV